MHRNNMLIGINIFILILECQQAYSAITLNDLTNVAVLTTDNFDRVLEKNDLFVLFYAAG